MTTKTIINAAALAIVLTAIPSVASADIANVATQQTCEQVGSDAAPVPRTSNQAWAAGALNRALDRQVYKKEIVAYRIQWSNKKWSGWYVKGVNDLDWKTPGSQPGSEKARLVWVYFYDHPHQYIACS